MPAPETNSTTPEPSTALPRVNLTEEQFATYRSLIYDQFLLRQAPLEGQIEALLDDQGKAFSDETKPTPLNIRAQEVGPLEVYIGNYSLIQELPAGVTFDYIDPRLMPGSNPQQKLDPRPLFLPHLKKLELIRPSVRYKGTHELENAGLLVLHEIGHSYDEEQNHTCLSLYAADIQLYFWGTQFDNLAYRFLDADMSAENRARLEEFTMNTLKSSLNFDPERSVYLSSYQIDQEEFLSRVLRDLMPSLLQACAKLQVLEREKAAPRQDISTAAEVNQEESTGTADYDLIQEVRTEYLALAYQQYLEVQAKCYQQGERNAWAWALRKARYLKKQHGLVLFTGSRQELFDFINKCLFGYLKVSPYIIRRPEHIQRVLSQLDLTENRRGF